MLPGAVLCADDVLGIVDRLVDALDGEAVVLGGQPQRGRGVGHADAVVEAALAVLLEDEVLGAAAHPGQVAHRDVDPVLVGLAAGEAVLAGVAVAEPGAGHEVGGDLLVGAEVAVHGQEDEGVLLGVGPVAAHAVGEQAAHDLGDEVAPGLIVDERLEQDAVGAAIGVEQEIAAVLVAGGEVRGGGGLAGPVVEQAADGAQLGRPSRRRRSWWRTASRPPRAAACRRRRPRAGCGGPRRCRGRPCACARTGRRRAGCA